MCRAVGQVALALALATGLLAHARKVTFCLSGDVIDREVCQWMFSPPALWLSAAGVGFTMLAGWGLWATLRQNRVWIARCCAAVLAVPGPAWSIWSLLDAHDPGNGWGMSLWGLLVSLASPVVPLLLLLASYGRRATLTDDQAGLSGWLSMVLVPLLALVVCVQVVGQFVDLPLVGPLVAALGAGLLYGLLRRRYPLARAGHWLPATLILTALLLPEYTWLRWGTSHSAELFPGQTWQDTIAWALVLATVAVLALQLALTHRTRRQVSAARARRSGQPTGAASSPTPHLTATSGAAEPSPPRPGQRHTP